MTEAGAVQNEPQMKLIQTLGRTGAVAALALGIHTGQAVDLMPDFANIPTGWGTDRYEPHSFSNVGTFQGRDNVLGIEINSAEGAQNRPAAFSSGFYNTQGRKSIISGGAGDSIAADLWIPTSWSDPMNGNFRTDMWGAMWDGTSITAYPIIGFANFGGPNRFRAFDGEAPGGWVDLTDTVNFGAWNALEIQFTGTSFDYYVNGNLSYSDNTINGSTGFREVIMQAFNFHDSNLQGFNAVDYTAHWSNKRTASVPDGGATLGLLGLAVCGLIPLRRKLAA
jgi:hypothetical protein